MSTELNEVVLIHGVFRADFFDRLKKNVKNVVVLEGRPSLKASKDACAQLQKIGLTATVVADNMAGYLFSKGLVSQVWLASQTVDKNGAVCPIGSLILAVLAKKHQVAVFAFPSGEKSKPLGKPGDLQKFNGQNIVSGKVKAFVPLIEWVDAKYLSGDTFKEDSD